MIRTWVRQLRQHLFGGTSSTQSARRKPRAVPLSVEALEERQLLTGNTAGYLLNPNGNLYQQSSSVSILRDTGVRDFTAPKGILYDLHTNGQVMEFVNGVPHQIYSNASALVSDATGNVFALDAGLQSVVEHVPGTLGSWNPVSTTTNSLVCDATGNIFILNYWNGQVNEHVQGTGASWTTVGDHTAHLVSDASGNVFGLTYDGTVYEHILGGAYSWNTVGSTANNLVSDITGNVFALYSNGNVYEHNQGTGWSWTQVGSTANSLVSDATGNVFALYTNGTVYEHNQGTGWSWTVVDANCSRLVSDASGNVFSLSWNDAVCQHTLGGGYSWSLAGSNMANLVSDATGNVFALGWNGNVLEHNPGGVGLVVSTSWNVVDANCSRLVSDISGNVFALNFSDHRVYEHSLGTTNTWTYANQYNISSLVSDASGNLFDLSFGNNHVYEHVLGTTGTWNDANFWNTQSLVSDASGNVFALNFSDNRVYEHGLGTTGTWNDAGFWNTQSLVSDASGNVFTLSFGDNRVYEHVLGTTTTWNYANQYNISSLVSDASGNLFDLSFGDNNVYTNVPGSGTTWNQAGLAMVRSLLSDATGNVFGLTWDGTISEHLLGGYSWNTVGDSTSSLISDATGNIFTLTWDGTIYEHLLGGGYSWDTIGGNANSLVSDGGGKVFSLQGNTVYQFNGTGWSAVAIDPSPSLNSSVQAMARDAAGNVFVLVGGYGMVYTYNSAKANSWINLTGPIAIADEPPLLDHPANLVASSDGNVFWLTNNWDGYDQCVKMSLSPSALHWGTTVLNNVQAVGAVPNGLVALGNDGIVRYSAAGQSSTWANSLNDTTLANAAGGVSAIAVTSTGVVYALTYSGSLAYSTTGLSTDWHTAQFYHPGSVLNIWADVDVKGLAKGKDGQVYFVAGGNVYQILPTAIGTIVPNGIPTVVRAHLDSQSWNKMEQALAAVPNVEAKTSPFLQQIDGTEQTYKAVLQNVAHLVGGTIQATGLVQVVYNDVQLGKEAYAVAKDVSKLAGAVDPITGAGDALKLGFDLVGDVNSDPTVHDVLTVVETVLQIVGIISC